MIYRMECEDDYHEVEELTREAFWDLYNPGCTEHFVLHNLRQSEGFVPELDYVAEEDGKIIGHIVYARMYTEPGHQMSKDVICFGPISVHPDHQKKGIGRELIRITTEKARDAGYKAILITGDNQYYNQMGFSSATAYQVFLPNMDKSEEAAYFMALELEKGYLNTHPGVYDFDKCYYDMEGFDTYDSGFPKREKREARESDLS